MERREIRDILRGIVEARAQHQAIALASVVRVRGSAYRREGAQMLIRDDGSHVCMLSGGCLEPEVVLGAKYVMQDNMPSLTGYDLSEDVVWGLGIGCGGSVDIYVEPVNDDPILNTWLGILERGELAVLATLLPTQTTGIPSPALGRVLVRENGEMTGEIATNLEQPIKLAALEMMNALYPRPETRVFDSSSVFLAASAPPPELVIFGAGHDAIPLCARASDLGWAVTVIDARARFLTTERFPDAHLEVREDYASLKLNPRSFVMVMNHHLERDERSLKFALESVAPYVGVLGPRARFLDLLSRLERKGFTPTPAQLERTRNPVGLDIGAESPDEVALSIMGELIAVRRGFMGGVLNGRNGRIHDVL
jgi:xanthine dehydrogenase accessory factor